MDLTTLLWRSDQFTFMQYLHMLRNGWPGHFKLFCYGAGSHCLRGKQHEYRPPGRISDCLKGISSKLHRHLISCSYLATNLNEFVAIWLHVWLKTLKKFVKSLKMA